MSAWAAVTSRWHFWSGAIRETWGFPVLLVGFLWGVASFIRDEFVPDDIQTRYQILDWLPTWSVQAWGSFILALLVIVFIEAGYRSDQKRRGEVGQLTDRINNLLTPEITIIFREGDTRYLYTDADRQVIAICLFNGSLKTIDNIEIYSNGVIPIRLGAHNLTLRPRVSSPPMRLSPGEEHYVPVAWFSNGEFETIHYESGVTTRVEQGEEFLMKVVVVGRDMQAARKMLRFGVSNNEVYAAVATG